ncbi:MAG TPA: hypothetical protein DEO32_05410 [Ruminococcaceae bacterium]|nr:hypothetical protein [Oscillospiraceae bacterium]
MKKLTAIVLTIVLTVFFAGCGSKPAESSEASSTQAQALAGDVKSKLDETLTGAGFKGIVQITEGDNVIYEYVKGNDDNKKPLTIDSPMPIGSVSKQFCAACIMFLCEQNKLSTDDTLDKYYPNYKYGKKITIKNLLNMGSGIDNFLELVDSSEVGDDESKNIDLITKEISEEELSFEPGKDYSYSNSNYFLLANIAEQASGIAYHKFIKEQFFEPLGMKHTGFVEDLSKDSELASAVSVEEIKKEYVYNPGLTKGAGDIVSNAEDMNKWMRGLSGGKILSEEGFRQMTESVNPYSTEEYGYGLWHMPYGGVGHVGQIPPSFAAVDYINTGRNIYLYAMSNTGKGMSYVQQLPQELLSVMFEK